MSADQKKQILQIMKKIEEIVQMNDDSDSSYEPKEDEIIQDQIEDIDDGIYMLEEFQKEQYKLNKKIFAILKIITDKFLQ